ncbi:MAG: N-acetylmuramoyl-L-alanine amidase [Oscillospiraceae bacterium]
MFALICAYVMIYSAVHDFPLAVQINAGVASGAALPVIVLDAGHGGIDGGCVAVDGTLEKGINLAIMTTLRDQLVALGYTVEVTRSEDISIHDEGVTGLMNQKKNDMANRLALFNKYDNAICVSVHQNQFTSAKFNGAQMFYSAKNPLSQRLAQLMQTGMVSNLQPANKREIKLSGDELYLLYYCKNPAVMAECGFLSNPAEAALLENPDYQKKVAFTLCTAIVQFIAENYSME